MEIRCSWRIPDYLEKPKRYLKRLEECNLDAVSLWRRFRTLSIERYKKSYARLNVCFDEYAGESQVRAESIGEIERVLIDRKIARNYDGALAVNFEKHAAEWLGIAILRNRNGTTSYLLRDIGAAIERYKKHRFDKMIYVVMGEQNAHLQRLIKILSLMGRPYAQLARKMQYVTFGEVSGMSSHHGTVRFLDDILDVCNTSMREVMRRNPQKYAQILNTEEIAEQLFISAVMVQDMSGKRINSCPFDLARMTSFQGDTGPYLQYAYARLCSLVRKTSFTHQQLSTADLSLLSETHAITLLRILAQYPDTVAHTLKTLEPSTILKYLFRLARHLSSSYDVLSVTDGDNHGGEDMGDEKQKEEGRSGREKALARAALYAGARQVLGNGMRLLGLRPLERYVEI